MLYREAASKVRAAYAQGDRAEIKGMSRLGGGCYGQAYLQHSTQRVLKVSYSIEDGTMGWMATIAKHCAKHGRPPAGAPMVYEFGVGHKFWYAVMEHVDVAETATDWSYGHDAACALKAQVMAILGGRLNVGFDKAKRTKAKSSDDVYWDLHEGNVGRTRGGRIVTFDPFGSASLPDVKFNRHPIKVARQYGPARGRWAH